MHKVRPVCSSYLAFAVGIRNLDNYLDLHTGAEWDLRRAKRAAGMRAALAKDFQKKFGGAIGDLVRFDKAGSASSLTIRFTLFRSCRAPCNVARSSMATYRAAFLPSAVVISCPTLPENGLPSFFASRPDK